MVQTSTNTCRLTSYLCEIREIRKVLTNINVSFIEMKFLRFLSTETVDNAKEFVNQECFVY